MKIASVFIFLCLTFQLAFGNDTERKEIPIRFIDGLSNISLGMEFDELIELRPNLIKYFVGSSPSSKNGSLKTVYLESIPEFGVAISYMFTDKMLIGVNVQEQVDDVDWRASKLLSKIESNKKITRRNVKENSVVFQDGDLKYIVEYRPEDSPEPAKKHNMSVMVISKAYDFTAKK